MSVRALLGVLALGVASAGVAGCDGDDDEHGYGRGRRDSEIVFGISQTKSADGKVSTSVGYEYLDILDHGWSAVGLVSRGRSCWAEKLDERLGQPRVEGGVATFEGGVLPDKGIAVVANRPDDLVLDAPAWQAAGDELTFQANGFAMPSVGPYKLRVPATELAVTAPAASAAELAIDGTGTAELELGWTTGPAAVDGPPESVVASLVAVPEGTPDARGVELRCFFERSAGSGKLPQELVKRFASLVGQGRAPIKGKLRIATHRQLTIHARGGWTVYVVASVDQREQPFALSR